MSHLIPFFERHTALFERYLISSDKPQFTASLTDPIERKVLQLLTQPMPQKYEEHFKELRLNRETLRSIAHAKQMASLRNSSQQTQRENIIDQIIKTQFQNVNFQASKPAETISYDNNSNIESKEEDDSKSHLKIQQGDDFRAYVNGAIKPAHKVRNLNEYGLKQLQHTALLGLPLQEKELLLQQHMMALRTFPDEFVVEFLLSVAHESAQVKKRNTQDQISMSCVRVMSQKQVNLLREKCPQLMTLNAFVKRWFDVNYQSRLESLSLPNRKKKLTLSEMDANRKTLVTIKAELEHENCHLLSPYISQLFLEILVLDLKREDPSKELFFEFVKSIQTVLSCFNREHNEEIKKTFGRNGVSHSTPLDCAGLVSTAYNQNTLIQEYVVKMLKKYKDSEGLKAELSRYLDSQYVNRTHAELRLFNGQEVADITDFMSNTQLENAKTDKFISIVQEKTESYFKTSDDVALHLSLKNIKHLRVKVYQINLEQFYLQNPNKDIDPQLNLQYLSPSVEQTVEVGQLFKNAFHRIEHELMIEQIPKSFGLHIVELQGEGITSRAVIRKGAIVCFQENHIDGQLLKFYDEDGQIIQNLRLWVKGREETVTDGTFLIPFSKRRENFSIIAVKDHFAERINVNINPESYTFDVGMLFNSESFIVGKKAKIVMHPVLKLGREKISLQNLSKVTVKADLLSNLNIKSSIKHENVKFSDDSDYILEIPIKSYTKSISVSVECEVKDLEKKVIPLSFHRNIAIDLLESSNNVIDLYLKREDEGRVNTLRVQGLNGEGLSRIGVNVELQLYGTSDRINRNLQTNRNGEVFLGPLNFTRNLRVSVSSSNGTVSRSWNLADDESETGIFFQDCLRHFEGDSVVIPISFSHWNLNKVTLPHLITFQKVYEKNRDCYQNCIHDIEVKEKGDSGVVHLTVPKVTAGVYELCFLRLGKVLRIQVLGGKRWKDGSVYDENQGTVSKFSKNYSSLITIGKAKQHEYSSKDEYRKVTIPIHIPEGTSEQIDFKNIRVHLNLKNYTDSTMVEILDGFNLSSLNTRKEFEMFMLEFRRSSYFSNKKLSDEQSYVLNREAEKKFIIGNNLEKPKIFLKRIEVRDTRENEEQLEAEGRYRERDQNCLMRAGCYAQEDMARMKKTAQRYHSAQLVQELGLNSHNNFIKTSGTSLFNAKYRQELEIKVPLNYSEVNITLIAEQSAIQKSIYLNRFKEAVENAKDLRHGGLKEADQKKAWSMSRQVYVLQKGEKHQVSRDSMWCTVTLSNILQFAAIKGHKIPEWVSQWQSYSREKKLQVYDEEVCHQLNVFIQHHDLEFFNEVVRPFIANKVQKTFVDWCLLGDFNRCSVWAQTHKIDRLNQFERMLLIEQLVKNNKVERAREIADSMEQSQRSIKRGFEQYKELFDIVLNSEASKPKPKPQVQQKHASFNSLKDDSCRGGGGGAALFGMMAPQSTTMSRNMRFSDCRMQEEDEEQELAFDMMGGGMEAECEMVSEANESLMMVEQCKKSPQRKMKNTVRGAPGGLNSKVYKPGFKQVQKTKQYTQTTYSGIKDPSESRHLVPANLFWAKLSSHIANPSRAPAFVSEAFLYFTRPIEFVLASCFIPSDLNPDYELSPSGEGFIIEANSPFAIFVKEVKELDFQNKFGVLINQRFFSPQQRFRFQDDGTQIENEVEEFLVNKVYALQTVVTNTSGTNLELQILMDVPSGSLPLQSHEYVKIVSATVNAYSTQSFERYFYFPSEGTSELYPANACRNNSVIAKAAKLSPFEVRVRPTVNKLESFSDIMRSGSKKEILEYISKRNIHDPNIFSPYSVLWLIKEDKDFFIEVTAALRKRNFYDNNIWSYGVYHKDYNTTFEYLEATRNDLKTYAVPIFEYFPYYSSRCHKFQDESKSTIRNVQFKQTYQSFIICSMIEQCYGSSEKLAFAYYLLLQDRIEECVSVFGLMNKAERDAHRLQSDYLECYLSICRDYPNFATAQKLSHEYKEYPVKAWAQMFKEIYNTLEEYKNDKDFEEDPSTSKKVKVDYRTSVINEGDKLRVSVPPEVRVQVYFYGVNLELYFSDFPFTEVDSLSVIKPKIIKRFESGSHREETVNFAEVQSLGNVIAQVYEFKEGVPAERVSSLFWADPAIKVKVSQNEGSLQVFCEGKKQSGCYCKVYAQKSTGNKFYRDGYTDITGTFKYALSDLDGIEKFAVLAMTKRGGVIHKVGVPSRAGHYV